MGLAWMTAALGVVFAFFGVGLLAFPGGLKRSLLRFPRHRLGGCLLATLGLAWFGVLLYQTPWMEPILRFKPLLLVAWPVLIVLVCLYVDDLLAPRALGGLLVLFPQYLLDAGRWHPSPLSLVTQSLAYLFVIAGVALVLAPYLFRRATEGLFASGRLLVRLVAVLTVALGLLLLALGIVFFRYPA